MEVVARFRWRHQRNNCIRSTGDNCRINFLSSLLKSVRSKLTFSRMHLLYSNQDIVVNGLINDMSYIT